jgi:6-phosphogluconolactonase
MPQPIVLASLSDLTLAAARMVVGLARDAVAARGRFTIALSGGNTPAGLYRLLGGEGDTTFRDAIDWPAVEVFWSDERHVPPNDPTSNYRMAAETLLTRVPIPPPHIHRIAAEWPDAEVAARAYETALRTGFNMGAGDVPRLDLLLLGMGPDGHTASLFPGSPAIEERRRLVAAPWVAKLNAFRITLTPPVLDAARAVIVLVSGTEKADALWQVLRGDEAPDRFPAQVLRAATGAVTWLVDEAAASRL